VSSVAGVVGRAPLRPKLIEFFNCTDVTIEKFTAQNAACWTIHPTYSTNVLVRQMTVLGPREIGGVDGIDPDSCVNCLVDQCHVDIGDDGISIKSYNYSYVPGPTPCHNVTIRRSTILSRNICLGSGCFTGLSGLVFSRTC
jgi:polygalacturonase